MGEHDCGRLTVILISVACFVTSLVFNALAVIGGGKSLLISLSMFFLINFFNQ